MECQFTTSKSRNPRQHPTVAARPKMNNFDAGPKVHYTLTVVAKTDVEWEVYDGIAPYLIVGTRVVCATVGRTALSVLVVLIPGSILAFAVQVCVCPERMKLMLTIAGWYIV
jgi:hypothetical protein